LTTQITGYQLLTLASGTIAILLAVYTLSYMWWPYGREDPSRFWNRLVSLDYIPQIITICSAVIRVSVSVHCLLCCGMIASISLTRRQVLFQDAAAISIARCEPSGPFSILLPLFLGTTRKINIPQRPALHNVKSSGGQRYICFVLITVVALLSVTTQFTSTILLYDLGKSNVPGRIQNENVTYRQDTPGKEVAGFAVGTQNPPAYPVFAESTEGTPEVINYTEHGGLVDTRGAVRAFFPFSKANRSSIISYRGPAYVVDSHVLCFSPIPWGLGSKPIDDLSTHASHNPPPYLRVREETTTDKYAIATNITGQLGTSVLNRYLNSEESKSSFAGPGDFNISFTCTVPVANNIQFHVLCTLQSPGNDTSEIPAKKISVHALNWFLVVDAGSLGVKNWSDVKFGQSPKPIHTGDEWTLIKDESSNFTLRMSLCVSSFGVAGYSNVKAEGLGNYMEPELSMDQIGNAQSYNTSLIRKQLGVLSSNHSERNILNLTWLNNSREPDENSAVSKLTDSIRADKSTTTNISYIAGCNICYASDPATVHPVLSSLYFGVLNDTMKLPQAIQAIMTVVTSMSYYDRLTFGNKVAQAEVQRRGNFTVPIRLRGFFVVVGLLVVHFLLVLIILGMFLRDPRNVVGQYWQTIAQLHQGEAQEFLDEASGWDDDRVKQWMEEEGRSWSHSIVDIKGPDNKVAQVAIGFVGSTPGRLAKFGASVENVFRSMNEFLTR
jgi:hypothetical protein